MSEYAGCLAPDGVAIFLFHGVIPIARHTVRNYTRKHLTLERFESVLRALLARGTPVSMARIAAARRDGASLPPFAFAITFDDGFENNVSVAAPVLEALDLPATFYVTTGFIDGNLSSWTDMIEYAVERTLRCELDLPVEGARHSCERPEDKIDLLDAIRRAVKSDPRVDPYEFARGIWRQLGVSEMEYDPFLDRKMSWCQVRQLAEHPLFAVGGHGHTHRILSYLSDDELEREIDTSLARLRENLPHPVEHYSYPEGLAHCYDERVVEALRRRGILSALTAEPGVNDAGVDLFQLKRIMVV